MKTIKYSRTRLLGALFALILAGCSTPDTGSPGTPVNGTSPSSPSNSTKKLPKSVEDLTKVGLNFTEGEDVVGGEISRAWCKELKSDKRSFAVFEFAPLIESNPNEYETLLKKLVKEFVGDNPTESTDQLVRKYSKVDGNVTRVIYSNGKTDENPGLVQFNVQSNSISYSPTDRGENVTSQDILRKVKDFLSKYAPSAQGRSYYIDDYDAEREEGDPTAKPRTYSVTIGLMYQGVPLTGAGLTSVELTFDINGDLRSFSFAPGSTKISEAYSEADILTPEEALQQASQKAGVTEPDKYTIKCQFDYIPAWDKNKKLYFIPAYSYLYKLKQTDSHGYNKNKGESVIALKSQKILDELSLDNPYLGYADPSSDK